MIDEDLMFDTGVLDDDEMFVEATTGEKDEHSTKIDDSTVPKRPLTKKDQVVVDEDLARNIQAQLNAEIIEEERLERQ
ncbi:hypothetical protein Tco_0482335 [Tanacetum coccineum]